MLQAVNWQHMLLPCCCCLLSLLVMSSRGCFIVLEGTDRCGKTTQAARLAQRLQAQAWNFPQRTTQTGQMIDSYLKNVNHSLNDQAIHLLFSANRWESVETIVGILGKQQQHIVCDRYAYSGVAFSVAKGLDWEWCKAPDRGLPQPDCVVYLDISAEEAAARQGFGEERYEKQEFQAKVRNAFGSFFHNERNWNVVNAAQTPDQVEADIWKIVQPALEQARQKPLGKLWHDGQY